MSHWGRTLGPGERLAAAVTRVTLLPQLWGPSVSCQAALEQALSANSLAGRTRHHALGVAAQGRFRDVRGESFVLVA